MLRPRSRPRCSGFQAREDYYDVLDQNIAAEQVCGLLLAHSHTGSSSVRSAHASGIAACVGLCSYGTQLQAAWRGKRVRNAIEEGDFEFLGTS